MKNHRLATHLVEGGWGYQRDVEEPSNGPETGRWEREITSRQVLDLLNMPLKDKKFVLFGFPNNNIKNVSLKDVVNDSIVDAGIQVMSSGLGYEEPDFTKKIPVEILCFFVKYKGDGFWLLTIPDESPLTKTDFNRHISRSFGEMQDTYGGVDQQFIAPSLDSEHYENDEEKGIDLATKFDKAYKEGKLAATQGKEMKENPYPGVTHSSVPTPYGEWLRGWMSINLKKLKRKQ